MPGFLYSFGSITNQNLVQPFHQLANAPAGAIAPIKLVCVKKGSATFAFVKLALAVTGAVMVPTILTALPKGVGSGAL